MWDLWNRLNDFSLSNWVIGGAVLIQMWRACWFLFKFDMANGQPSEICPAGD